MLKYKISKTFLLMGACSLLFFAGCGQNTSGNIEPTNIPVTQPAPEDTATPAPTESAVSADTPVPTETIAPAPTIAPGEEWKSNLGTINLSDLSVSGTGVTVDGTTIRITAGGDFTIIGTLENGKIVVSTTERVKLRLTNASIICNNDSAIYVEQADKAFITIEDGTTNSIVSGGTEEAAIYSKDDLEIKGKGSLSIVSKLGHGIKASDDLNIENGTITINAAKDGIHINETCGISGGSLNITAAKDGIESEENLILRGGSITINARKQAYTAEGEVTIEEGSVELHVIQ